MTVLFSAAIWAFRVLMALRVLLLSHFDVVAFVWVLSELVQAWYGLLNFKEAIQWDRRMVALSLPILYLFSYAFTAYQPEVPHYGVAFFMLCVLALKIWIITYMGAAYSAAVPNVVTLKTDGPFRWVRHPLLVVSMFHRCLFLLAFPCLQNLAVVVYGVLIAAVTVKVEESFLSKHCPGYESYRRRVPSVVPSFRAVLNDRIA